MHRMWRIVLLCLSLVLTTTSGIASVYEETFDGTHGWTLNVSTGVNGADHNFWVVNDNESGIAPGACGGSHNGDQTLHITATNCATCGAIYNAGGLCGFGICPETHVRAESPAFSTLGQTQLTLEFDFVSMGDGTVDNASVLFNAGSGWQVLQPSIKSTNCPDFNGLWARATIALPAEAINQASVRIGFDWTNNDDGSGTDPSVAINNVRVLVPDLAFANSFE